MAARRSTTKDIRRVVAEDALEGAGLRIPECEVLRLAAARKDALKTVSRLSEAHSFTSSSSHLYCWLRTRPRPRPSWPLNGRAHGARRTSDGGRAPSWTCRRWSGSRPGRSPYPALARCNTVMGLYTCMFAIIVSGWVP